MGNNSVKNVNTSGDLHGLYACFSKIPIWLDHTHMDWLFEVTHSNTPLHYLRRILSFFSYFCLQIEIENYEILKITIPIVNFTLIAF